MRSNIVTFEENKSHETFFLVIILITAQIQREKIVNI